MASAISFPSLLTLKSIPPPKNLHRPSILRPNPAVLRLRFSANDNGGGAPETPPEKKKEEAVKADRRTADDLLLGGVAEEVKEIEWPEIGQVVGTTGVVVAVIAGSGLALLTVNAVLAELSDRVFAGKGVQDFFSG